MKIQSAKSTSFRWSKDLQKSVNEWLKHHASFNMSQLINVAVLKFITEEQVLLPVKTIKANNKKVNKVARSMIKKHADILEKLK